MTKALVTGGAGFIGSHLAETLMKRGDEVVVLDNLSTGKSENIEYLKGLEGNFTFLKGSTENAEDCRKAVEGCDFVFHQAALGSVPKSVADPLSSHEANATGTLQILIAAKDARVKRLVNAASSSAYGDTETLPKHEGMQTKTLSPYAVTKLAQEEYCRAFANSYGLGTVSLRYFNVYGPRQDPFSQYAAVIPNFFKSFLNGESPEIFGDGEQTRDFTFVGDVVRANIMASEGPCKMGEIFNIAGGRQITINELALAIGKLVGTDLKPTHLEARAGDIRDSWADISYVKEKLNFLPQVGLEEGLKRAEAWYRENL